MDLRETIHSRLGTLDAQSIDLVDDSHRHAGHAGAGGGGHFRLSVVSAAFEGKTALARHRLVYGLLADLIPSRVHALNIIARTPEEAAR
ncbi:MAG: BolA family protein [Candidatus Dactylopiibacterium sp.]|nr:BolA family protein [Candidatus Dactylopiibacterium sp.]